MTITNPICRVAVVTGALVLLGGVVWQPSGVFYSDALAKPGKGKGGGNGGGNGGGGGGNGGGGGGGGNNVLYNVTVSPSSTLAGTGYGGGANHAFWDDPYCNSSQIVYAPCPGCPLLPLTKNIIVAVETKGNKYDRVIFYGTDPTSGIRYESLEIKVDSVTPTNPPPSSGDFTINLGANGNNVPMYRTWNGKNPDTSTWIGNINVSSVNSEETTSPPSCP